MFNPSPFIRVKPATPARGDQAVPSQPTDMKDVCILYANLMEEIRRRVDVNLHVVDGKWSLPAMPGLELCYVQLRKICEIFALACLAAHGDIPNVRTKLMQKAYNADQIIKQLADLHPEFYPVPGKQRLEPTTGEPIEVVTIESGYLTKDDLLFLYGECGNYLHRGSIRQLLSTWEPDVDFTKIRDWVSRIITLLNHHQIQTIDNNMQLWVIMNERNTGKVYVYEMRKVS